MSNAKLPVVPTDYQPDEKEEYMSPLMRSFFRNKLLEWKQELLDSTHDTLMALQNDSLHLAESMERATAETDKALELRAKDRVRKLIAKIDQALRRVDTDDFGYCLISGENIGVKRLLARPIATMTVEAQEEKERQERFFAES